MIVLVTGGRDNLEWKGLWAALDELHPHLVVQGGATGFDQGARAWCHLRGVRCKTVDAPWNFLNDAAGTLRNLYMLDVYHPDIVLAGPGHDGTAHCTRAAVARGVEVRRVR